MKRLQSLFFAAGISVAATCAAITPEQSGGIYYAYPVESDSLAPVPEGFAPVYISHYGRHGSRWMIDLSKYDDFIDTLAKAERAGNLTPEGAALVPLVEICRDHAEGHSGELSFLGGRQHKGIAARMYHRFPMLFADTVAMRSSTVPRCIISMAAFSESLKDSVPELRISRTAGPGNMEFINYTTREAKEIGADTGVWMRTNYNPVRDRLTAAPATAKKIFRDIRKVNDLPRTMRQLHDIAIAIQDVDGLPSSVSRLLDIFEPEDYLNMWKSTNYQMFLRNSNATPGADYGPACAGNLLNDFIGRADAFLSGANPVTGDLRFGHDTGLARLLSLAGIEGCTPVAGNDADAVAEVWKTYEVSPMAANLQLILFRNASGEVIAALRHNESPVGVIGLEEFAPGYYRWADLKNYWKNRIETICR